MNQRIAKSLILIVLLLGVPLPLSAHENLPDIRLEAKEYPHILKCETACHKVKNISLAKTHRTTRPECQQCHVGIDKTPASPFLSPDKVFLPGTSGLVKKPDHQLAFSTTKNTPASNAPASTVTAKVLQKKTAGETDSMALIPEGEFIMGSNERWDDEAPEYIESTKKFFIDLKEVSNSDYEKFTLATKREVPYHWPGGKVPKKKENHPVTYVNWYDAKEYCQWKGKRLPTEQEWEKAARGENGNIYPWGNIWMTDKSNHPYKGSTGTEPVGSYPEGRSPYGLYDMSGNVWEWVDSYYLPHPGNTVTRGEYGKDKRVLKGGSWFDCLSYGCGLSAPTFNRSFFTPEVKNNSFGFRCAKTP
ncbi:MAG: SUMF1/EgtB/PvdO family nonheme iron enzyme [Nitrospinaceae bacterium]|nr:SUMF1/EgtB/PvdO family nonheme iron enzyme [Nitrospinaceae bacterium]MDP6711150.1 SUMF1/EgtB/PvdO family nonheme iron enzyme [Nitrospinaceae bacterium]